MDRSDALIAMPVPIVTVRCEMTTNSVQGVIKPEVKSPGSSSQVVSWQPTIRFFKTGFDSPTAIPVPAINPTVSHYLTVLNFIYIVQEGYGYIVGELIHVVVTGFLNGQVPSNVHQVNINFCRVVDSVSGESVVRLIENNQPVESHTPVYSERLPGYVGGSGLQGAAFSFQVFTYRSTGNLKLVCSAEFIPHIGSGTFVIILYS